MDYQVWGNDSGKLHFSNPSIYYFQAKSRIEYALRSGDYSKLVDSKLQKNYVEEELKTMISCAGACLYKPSKSRPLMKQVKFYYIIIFCY